MPYRKPISYLIRVQNIIQGKVSSPFIIRGAWVSLAMLASDWPGPLSPRPLIGRCEISLDYLAIVCEVWLLKSGFLYKTFIKREKRTTSTLLNISRARSFNEKSLINNSFFKDTNQETSFLKYSPAVRTLCCLFHFLITLCKCLV